MVYNIYIAFLYAIAYTDGQMNRRTEGWIDDSAHQSSQ